MAARKIMTEAEVNAISEKIADMLKGTPVRHALDILKITERNLLWNCTVSKPEDRIDLANQIDLEELIKQRTDTPTLTVGAA